MQRKERYREQLERYARLMVQRDAAAHPAGAVFPAARRMARMGRRRWSMRKQAIAVRVVARADMLR